MMTWIWRYVLLEIAATEISVKTTFQLSITVQRIHPGDRMDGRSQDNRTDGQMYGGALVNRVPFGFGTPKNKRVCMVVEVETKS